MKFRPTDQQRQSAQSGSLAIQSGGDTIINQGLSPDNLRAIIQAVAEQIPIYRAIARDIVEDRLQDFEEKVLHRFSTDASVDTKAFQDPDFQYLLSRSQQEFCRSGDQDLEKTLINLISERSKTKARSRLSLALSQAVEASSRLTVEEYAALSFRFLFSMTYAAKPRSRAQLVEALKSQIDPYIDIISREDSSYRLLEQEGCAVRSDGSEFNRYVSLVYPTYLTKGATKDTLTSIGAGHLLNNRSVLIPAIHEENNLQPNAWEYGQWQTICQLHNVAQELGIKIWQALWKSPLSKEEILKSLGDDVPRLADAYSLWDETPLRSMQLTPIGIAIGASFAQSENGNFDLSVWIK